MKDSKACF